MGYTRLVNGLYVTGGYVKYSDIFDANGKVKSALLPPHILYGYYNALKFYATRTGEGTEESPYVYSDEYTPVVDCQYVDLGNSNKLYVYHDSAYMALS